MSDKTIQNATVGTVQPGALTAIARKEDFLQHLQDFLNTHKTEKWCVAAIDVGKLHSSFPNLFADEFHITVLNILCIRQCIIAVNRKFTEFSRSHSEFFLKYIAKIVFVGEFQHI